MAEGYYRNILEQLFAEDRQRRSGGSDAQATPAAPAELAERSPETASAPAEAVAAVAPDARVDAPFVAAVEEGAALIKEQTEKPPAVVDEPVPTLVDEIDAIESEVRHCPWPDPVPTFTYLAGAAGSGKTFLTRGWAEQEDGLLLCATTGIAAINLGGTTINAILGYFDTKSLQDSFTNGMLTGRLGRLWKSGIRRLIVDEVSMMDGDQLTYIVRAIEEVNGRGYVLDHQIDRDDEIDRRRKNWEPLGLTLVGDFAQLPPVKAPFAFESAEWAKAEGGGDRFAEHTHTLTEIRRQADPDFIEALRAARRGDGRKAAEYFADRLHGQTDDTFAGSTILAKNESVDRYNRLRMDKLQTKQVVLQSSRWGKQRSEWGNPEKPAHTWGIPLRLVLKEQALVMILANYRDETGRLVYVNGDLGVLESVDIKERPEAPEVSSIQAPPIPDQIAHVRLQRTGQVVKVNVVTREVLQPCDAERRKELRDLNWMDRIRGDGKWEAIGGVTYMPLRLAYATTVHKAQGLSLDAVQVDIRDGFFKTPGMIYVALSRARTAGGLRLVGSAQAFIDRCSTDPRLKGWL